MTGDIDPDKHISSAHYYIHRNKDSCGCILTPSDTVGGKLIGINLEREYYSGLTDTIPVAIWRHSSAFTDSIYHPSPYDTSYGYIIFPSADDKGVSFNGHYAMKIDSVWNHRYNAYEVQDATESDQSIDLRKTIKIVYKSIYHESTIVFDLNSYYMWIPKDKMTKINL